MRSAFKKLTDRIIKQHRSAWMIIQLENTLKKILESTLVEKIDTYSIFLVGSNANNRLGEIENKDSDLDIIILNRKLTHKLNYVNDKLRYDISIINDDIVALLLSALQGNKTAGKVFSALNKYRIIEDGIGQGPLFVKIVNDLYQIFTKSCLPNFLSSSIFLHNINVNLKDLDKKDNIETFFAYQRLSNHLLDYTSSLIYPFHISGKYRGRVFRQNLEGFDKFLGISTTESQTYSFLAKKYLNRFTPVLEYEYYGVEYSKELRKEIISQNIKNFYFGYDNLVSEKTIVFLSKKDWSNYLGKSTFKLISFNNIVPGLSKEQHDLYIHILSTLSNNFFLSEPSERKEILLSIFNIFSISGLGVSIENTLHAAIILKAIIPMSKAKLKIELEDFKNWLDSITISISKQEMESFHDFLLKDEILFLTKSINDSSSQKEKEIKASYTFFGIMKAFRIQIEDLDF